MQLLLLGAGASKAYAESPTNVRMPISRDFFPTFEKLSIYEHPWLLRDGLIDYIARVKGEDPDAYLRSGIDIENLYSEIEQTLNDSHDREGIERVMAFKPYTQLTFIFAAVLNEIQNGPPSSVHIELAQQLNADDVVVTFNWDTLMDRALHVTGEWTADRGYGFLPRSIHRQGWQSPNDSDCAPETKLIKLHGSTNWLTSHPINAFSEYELTQEAAPNTVWVYESTSAPYACFAGRFLGGYEDFSYGYYPPNILDDPGRKAPDGHVLVRIRPKFPWVPEGTAPDSGLVSIPLIIPPVHNKRYSAFGALFDELWEAAENGIYSADHIIIIGYSFPNTDYRSNKLFLSALGKRSTVPFVTVFDPAPEAIEYKLHMEFGIPKSHLRVRKQFLTESTDFADLFIIS